MKMRIGTLCGSLRSGSYNRKLLAVAETELAKFDVEIDHIELSEYPMPEMNEDLENEKGLPENAWKLKARLAACQGILICSPEYNGGVPGWFKNVIDWTSRGDTQPWLGKVVALMGATPGLYGTWRMMPSLRQSLIILEAIVISEQINQPRAKQVWDESGKLLDEQLPKRVHKVVAELVSMTKRMKTE